MSPEFVIGEQLDDRRRNVAGWIQGSLQPVARLIAQGNLPIDDQEIIDEAHDFEVREYQLDAWANLWEARQAGAKSGLIHLATGLGKTSVGVFDVLKFREEQVTLGKPNPKILFACHKNEILEQAADRFATFIPNVSRGFYNGQSKELEADITFATLQSLHNIKDEIGPDYFDYIIYDEAHHAKAETFEEVVEHFKPSFQLALTATPDRLDKLDIRQLFGEELYSKGLSAALAEGWLAQPDYHIVFDDAVKEAMQSGFEPTSLMALARLFDVKPRNEVITKNIREEMQRIGLEFGAVKTIVFCQNVEHTEEMAVLLGGKPYHSGVELRERDNTLDEFKNGDLQVICTRDMFNEGLDVPDARLLVFLRSTSSQTVFEQQLGRGLRKHATKERVSVLDFVANVDRVALIKELAQEVSSRQSNGNNNNSTEDGTIRVDGGFDIHTAGGDFDFDKLAVDLLQKYSELLAVEAAPENFMTIKAAADTLGISHRTVVRICEANGWNLPTYRHARGVGLFVNQEQLEILAQHPEASTPQAKDKMYSYNTLSKESGVSPKLLEEMIEEQGWELPMHKFGPRIAPGISSAQFEALRSAYPDRFIPIAPDGWLSLKQTAKEIGADYYRAKKMVEENEFELTRYRQRGTAGVDMLSPEQINKLKQNINGGAQYATDDVISFRTLSKEVDLPAATLKKYAADLEIQPGMYRFGRSGTLGEGLTTEQVELLKADSRISNFAPDGYMNTAALAKSLGIYQQPLERVIKQLDWELPKFRGRKKGSRISGMLSPEQIEILKATPKVQELILKHNQS